MSTILLGMGVLFVIISTILIYRMLTASVGEEEIKEVKEAEKGFPKT
jgi:hypothetical protein